MENTNQVQGGLEDFKIYLFLLKIYMELQSDSLTTNQVDQKASTIPLAPKQKAGISTVKRRLYNGTSIGIFRLGYGNSFGNTCIE